MLSIIHMMHPDVYAFHNVIRVSRVPEGCQIELTLFLVTMTEDVRTELRCVTQNQGGRQEVVTQLQLEGKMCFEIHVNALSINITTDQSKNNIVNLSFVII